MNETKRSKAAEERIPEVCPNCGGMEFDVESRTQTFSYGKKGEDVDLVAEVPVLICRKCNFEFTDERAEDARHEAVCRHLGVMSPGEIANLRRVHEMSRAEFAEVSKLGTASLARWEAGLLIQNPANDQLLYLLRFEENIERLRDRSASLTKPSAVSSTRTFCRQQLRGRFRTIANLEERRSMALSWSLRGRLHVG